MRGPDSFPDPLLELRFALAEAGARPAPAQLWPRVLEHALSRRAAGRSRPPAADIRGAEVFGRAAERLNGLLGELELADWRRPALRDLDVQGLMGHLIGVEREFLGLLQGEEGASPAGAHVASTQGAALAQAGRPPAETRTEWAGLVQETLDRVVRAADMRPWYGISLPLDLIMVVRGFELWIHEEDVRRATDRALVDPDEDSLARMTDLAATLLSESSGPIGFLSTPLRLVLTGPGGGTWDLPPGSDGAPGDRPGPTRVVLGAAAFCRIVASRLDPDGAGALVDGDEQAAGALFAAAGALALD